MPYTYTHTHTPVEPLSCDIFEDVTFVPNTVTQINPHGRLGAFHKGKPLTQAHLYWAECDANMTTQAHYFEAEEIINDEVIYGGIFLDNHYGHFITESLTRLWYAKKHNLPIVWYRNLNLKNKAIKKWTIEIFEKLGIKNEIIFIDKPIQFKKVHFPQPGLFLYSYCNPEYIDFLACYEEREVIKGKYVYFSRANFSKQNCTNEVNLENILKERGWLIVYPETLLIAEQLELLTTAEVCCMIAGSAQHTLLFVKNSKTRFIMLPRVGGLHYDLIAHFKARNYFNLNLEREIINKENTSQDAIFSYNLKQFKRYLIETKDFTYNVENLPEIFIPSKKIEDKHLTLPEKYYSADLTILNDNNNIEKNLKKIASCYIKLSYLRYKILSEITFGNIRKHYKAKKHFLGNNGNIYHLPPLMIKYRSK